MKPALQLPVHAGAAPSQAGESCDGQSAADGQLRAAADPFQRPMQARRERIVNVDEKFSPVRIIRPRQPDGAEAAGKENAAVQRLLEARGQNGASATRAGSLNRRGAQHHMVNPGWQIPIRAAHRIASLRLPSESFR